MSRDAFSGLKVSPKVRRCLREIKAEVEGAYREEIRALRKLSPLLKEAAELLDDYARVCEEQGWKVDAAFMRGKAATYRTAIPNRRRSSCPGEGR